MDIKAQLGRRLKALREEAGFSQEELAHSAGISRVFVGSLERGQKAATVETLEKLGHALGVTPSFLLRVEEGVRKPTQEDLLGRRVSVLARGASPADLDRFERLARTYFTPPRLRRGRRGGS